MAPPNPQVSSACSNWVGSFIQPPPELREKMLTLFAKAKGTSPPDINAKLSRTPKLWGLIRQLIAVDPSEEQVLQIEQLICAGVSASGGTTNDVE